MSDPAGRRPPLYGPAPLGLRLARAFAARTLTGNLRQTLRRAVWDAPTVEDPAPGRPLAVFANHHVYPDSFLLWHWLTQRLGRPMVVWMAEWERAPLFGPIGALPFPADDPRARAATVRETIRRMTADPRTGLFVFPEGTMHPPEDGLAPFRADLPRLARLLPASTAWLPVGIRTSWWGDERPTAILGAGDVGPPDGSEPERLAAVLERLDGLRPADLAAGRAALLFDGRPGANERWDLSAVAPVFRRLSRGRGFGPPGRG